ncbi:hypothetical protein [Tautonia rosea]|uniref:hypothetical protein n=1 Tax=Tautonia rosea TaxID=2728037 RepID=UPI00147347F0|nr:hypothetical protein [Tautonia rosea]
MAKPLSSKQLDANRRNARNSTGPKTVEGKARSRRNGLTHGLAAQVVVPDDFGLDLERALQRWEREAGPDNVVEQHLVRRAAVASVTLDRLDNARESTRLDSARDAVQSWERRRQARARRKGQNLPRDPVGTVADLEATAFGCDWLIRQWDQLDAPLRLGNAWTVKTLLRAQLLLGLPAEHPGPDAEDPVRRLWLLASILAPTRLAPLPLRGDDPPLPSDPATARQALRLLIAEQIDRLSSLRAEAWDAVEGPEYQALLVRSSAADTSSDGQLRHRYARDADRSCNAAVRLYLNLRDRRRRELLAIAREARQCDTPRAPVGFGWWREPDSAPAPPGFTRILPDLDPAPRSPGEETSTQPAPPLAGERVAARPGEGALAPTFHEGHPDPTSGFTPTYAFYSPSYAHPNPLPPSATPAPGEGSWSSPRELSLHQPPNRHADRSAHVPLEPDSEPHRSPGTTRRSEPISPPPPPLPTYTTTQTQIDTYKTNPILSLPATISAPIPFPTANRR